jgi:hypothetical protein
MTQQHLFDNNGALFSPCRNYRYALFRMWYINDPLVMFIGLNPSTANEHDNDPTIRRVIRFAQDWGYGGVYMMNLFPLVSSNPDALLNYESNPLHVAAQVENNKWLEKAYDKCEKVIFAWGNFYQAQQRAKEVMQMFKNAEALAINKSGSPRHPLYVPGNVTPQPFTIPVTP